MLSPNEAVSIVEKAEYNNKSNGNEGQVREVRMTLFKKRVMVVQTLHNHRKINKTLKTGTKTEHHVILLVNKYLQLLNSQLNLFGLAMVI